MNATQTISTEVALVDFVERVRVKLGSLSDPSLKCVFLCSALGQ